MSAFPDVMHFFTDKLAGLGGRRLSFALCFLRSFDGLFLWHGSHPPDRFFWLTV
jgi:hypothetical protein